MTFDRRALLQQISAVSPVRRLIVSASCAERLIPFYEQFWVKHGAGPSLYRKSLNMIWNYLEHGVDQERKYIEEVRAAAFKNVPDEDELPPEVNYAQDAAIAVTRAIDVWLTGDPNWVAACLELCYDVVDNFVMNRLAPDGAILAEDEVAVLRHPIVQAELARQQRFFSRMQPRGRREPSCFGMFPAGGVICHQHRVGRKDGGLGGRIIRGIRRSVQCDFRRRVLPLAKFRVMRIRDMN